MSYHKVPHNPLIDLKTKGFKGAPLKGKDRGRFADGTFLQKLCPDQETRIACKSAFEALKSRLCAALTLAFPDFDRPFKLYVNGSKERGFGAALHQMDTSEPLVERPILYISKTLSPAERRY